MQLFQCLFTLFDVAVTISTVYIVVPVCTPNSPLSIFPAHT